MAPILFHKFFERMNQYSCVIMYLLSTHNVHDWAVEDPHTKREHNNQQRFSLNVWSGITGKRLIGPRIYSSKSTKR